MSSMKLKFSVYIFLLKSDCRYDLYLLTAGTESERGLATRQEGKQSTSVLASVLFKKCESFLTMLEWCFSNNSARLPQSFPEKYSRTPVKIFSWWFVGNPCTNIHRTTMSKTSYRTPLLPPTDTRTQTHKYPSHVPLRNLSQKSFSEMPHHLPGRPLTPFPGHFRSGPPDISCSLDLCRSLSSYFSPQGHMFSPSEVYISLEVVSPTKHHTHTHTHTHIHTNIQRTFYLLSFLFRHVASQFFW